MKKVYVFLADGFEEIEGLTVVDLLRRAKIDCVTVSISDSLTITGSHQIKVQADRLFTDAPLSDADMLVLPGGLGGTNNLHAHAGVKALLSEYFNADKYVTAICAAPSILGDYGFLNGRKATCYPGFEDHLTGADYAAVDVVSDKNTITSRGMGTAIDFSLALITALIDAETAKKIADQVQYFK